MLDRLVAGVAVRDGQPIADEVHHRLLRRMTTGRTLTDVDRWFDPDGLDRPGLYRWLERAVEGETAGARAHRVHDADVERLAAPETGTPSPFDPASSPFDRPESAGVSSSFAVASPSTPMDPSPSAASPSVVAGEDHGPDEVERRQLLALARRHSRDAPMRARTRELALRVVELRLAGATYAQAAAELDLRTNTAVQYQRRLVATLPERLRARIGRAVASTGRYVRPPSA
ncbi:MAG: hypothetical protein M0P31_17970 [Solirubrobacteraceae bacterium]|nr:hypothetical protein [Solirubrobacteraceae bacterium]